jgi:hypothetical protein
MDRGAAGALERAARELRLVIEALEAEYEAEQIEAERRVSEWAGQHGLEFRPLGGNSLSL